MKIVTLLYPKATAISAPIKKGIKALIMDKTTRETEDFLIHL